MYRIRTILLLGLGIVLPWIRSAECFQSATVVRLRRSQGAPSSLSRAARASSELRVSEEDRERDLKFERELDRDAELWVNGDPGKQKLWDKAKAWRRLNQMILEREEAMSELERDRLRYLLKDVQTVTGLPLLDGKDITPLAWCITLTIQFMPLAAIYIVVSSVAMEHNPQPVLDASRPFWA
eukprot:g7381.t1